MHNLRRWPLNFFCQVIATRSEDIQLGTEAWLPQQPRYLAQALRKSVTLGIRVTPSLRDQLKAASAKSGRTARARPSHRVKTEQAGALKIARAALRRSPALWAFELWRNSKLIRREQRTPEPESESADDNS